MYRDAEGADGGNGDDGGIEGIHVLRHSVTGHDAHRVRSDNTYRSATQYITSII